MANRNVKILAFVGLTGSGKSTAAAYMASKGFPKLYFGGVIYDAMKDAGIDITPENAHKFREAIRAEKGDDFVVRKIIPEAKNLINAGQNRIIADGIYSWTEYKIMKKEFPGELTVVAIVSPKKLRHRRLINRPTHPLSQFEADQRDWSEIENLEKGGPIAIADYYIINDGTLEDLYKKIDSFLEEKGFME